MGGLSVCHETKLRGFQGNIWSALVSLERRKPFIALVKTKHFDLQTSLRAEEKRGRLKIGVAVRGCVAPHSRSATCSTECSDHFRVTVMSVLST